MRDCSRLFPVLFFLFAGLVCTVACATGETTDEPTLQELGEYLEELEALRDMEQSAVSAYQAVSGPNFIDDKTLYTALDRETLPTYRDFANRLLHIQPQNTALSNLHATYVEAVRLQLRGFQLTFQYILDEDTELKREAYTEMQEAQQMMHVWMQSLNNLSEKVLQREDARDDS